MNNVFYLTTTLPYVNADPHIGFALEIVQADVLARWHASLGDDVFFNTGTDEHGIKIYRKAQEHGKDTQEYTDEYAAKFRSLKEKLNLYNGIHFIRTTDAHHKSAAQEFWKLCLASGDIYKKSYSVKYCVGCELEKTDSEIVDGKCPVHPNLDIELIDEENYFFKFSRFQKPLLDLYKSYPDFVVPDFRFNEIKSFVNSGLEDFSISRLKSKMPWGVPVPHDDSQVMYVWFDALINYISTLGWPQDTVNFAKFWGTMENPNAVQVAGKDNLRQQSAMWQAMLMSAGLPTTRQIMIHGFITSQGQKMSKSLGNVIDPIAVINEYGIDALRFYLLRHIHPFEDSDFTMDKFAESYNSDLVNGIGNVTARITKLAETHLSQCPILPQTDLQQLGEFLEKYDYRNALGAIMEDVQKLDAVIAEEKPFTVIKTNAEKGKEQITNLVLRLWNVACLLEPFVPHTAYTIQQAIKDNKKPENLFPRK